MININTEIDWFKKLKHGYHSYLGNDMSFFKYPDEELLVKGKIFTDREFEIIRLIQSGLNSEQIGEKLFLSQYTIDTHLRNRLSSRVCSLSLPHSLWFLYPERTKVAAGFVSLSSDLWLYKRELFKCQINIKCDKCNILHS